MSQNLTTVSNFQLERYLGTWYEIARLPMKHQPEDSTDISAVYTLNSDGTVRVQNRCLDGNKELDESIGEATVVDAEHGKLEVSFLPEGFRWIPFTKGDYWVLKIDENYQTALVGEPNQKYLWILHREPVLNESIKQAYLAYAQSIGYDLSDLIHTVHTGHKTA
ncbi:MULTISPECIES: lipocalin family protein [unclassified Acinetobacter]|uniref:lipocalin family protein n=1 Tax=unclassified Acinetobacter TaxID=196816 RepID=UPI00044FA2B8|nr:MULTISPECIES: lipocalin family protein [unclassified Acinetobacter]EZQ10367.1 membrane protein [Acinetobacter sp. Ver3]SEL69324.1 apolipoprotein D and lipocalin family protein [Acinetobacter sp. DSM 11652]